jgi:TonB family protein
VAGGDLLPQNTPGSKHPLNTDMVLAYSKRFLLYGFAISLLVHGTLGPLIEWKPQALGTPEPLESVSITTMPHTPEPTPVPTQSSTPSPATPRPHKVAQFVPRLPKTSAEKGDSESEHSYSNTVGSPEGIPQANADTGPPATLAPTLAPTPMKPACAVPKAPAAATYKATPEMPEIARQAGASGTAQILVNLDDSGRVVSASVYTSTRNSALDNAALQAAQQSRYSPARQLRENCRKLSLYRHVREPIGALRAARFEDPR